jgi:hypothetical protein
MQPEVRGSATAQGDTVKQAAGGGATWPMCWHTPAWQPPSAHACPASPGLPALQHLLLLHTWRSTCRYTSAALPPLSPLPALLSTAPPAACLQIHMVGESLARFGSNDFREGNNSSRAITAKDYEQLLRGFLQEFGACFQDEFVSEWPAGQAGRLAG